MLLLEKVRFNGINKDISPAAIDNGGNRMIVNPILDALNSRYISSENSEFLIKENIKGNQQVSNANLPAGTNTCIGTFEDEQNNKIFFFIHNSNADHCIFAFNPEDDSVDLIIKKSELNFQSDPAYLITGVGVINNLLIFSDGINAQRCINITRDYTYSGFSEKDICLIKRQPDTQLTVQSHYDYRTSTTNTVNTISDKSIQFSYRFVYLDDEVSVLAPYSNLAIAERWPDISNTAKGTIEVTLSGAGDYYKFSKKIEMLYREGNTGSWKVFKVITPNEVATTYTVLFTGNEFISDVSDSESSKIFESIPNYSKALAIQKNRLFLTDDQSGFALEGTLTITPSITSEPYWPRKTYWKKYGKKKVGIALFDEFERSIGVVFPTEFSIPGTVEINPAAQSVSPLESITYSVTSLLISNASKTLVVEKQFVDWLADIPAGYVGINIKLVYNASNYMLGKITAINTTAGSITVNVTSSTGSGTYAQWSVFGAYKAGTFTVVRDGYNVGVSISGSLTPGSKAKSYSVVVSDDLFYQDYVQCYVFAYFYMYDTEDSAPSGTLKYDGKLFKTTPPDERKDFSRIYLLLPRELGVVLDNSWYVRIIGQQKSGSGTPSLFNKVEKLIAIDGIFAIVNSFDVDNWEGAELNGIRYPIMVEFFKPRTTGSVITYREITERYAVNSDGTLEQASFSDLPGDTYVYHHRMSFKNIDKVVSINTDAEKLSTIVELPTPTTTTDEQVNFLKDDRITSANRQYVPDYSKNAVNRGIQFVEVEDNKRLFNSKTKIRFSNKFIQDTNVNGLNSFDATNQHSVSSERGQIKKLVPVSNNILAVHERACTTLYIEEGIIKSADGQDTLVTTSNVIGHDRKLLLGYGAYHPESVVHHDGIVFGFDVYKGVVWKYTLEGLFPISQYGMQDYFRNKGAEYLPIKDTCKIIGGIDPFNKEYLITFRKQDGTGETWAFNYVENKWITKYSFIPEFYGKIGNTLISFKSGQLWKHNASSTYNNFYGVQYKSTMRIAVNPYPSKKKAFNAVQLVASEIGSNVDQKPIKCYSGTQESYTKYDEFEKLEDRFYGPLMKDINTPEVEAGKIALRDGDDMRGDYIEIEVENELTTRAPLRHLNVTYNYSEFSV